MDPWIVMPSLIAIAIVFVVLPIALGTYTAYRGPKTVRCPVDGQPAAIRAMVGRNDGSPVAPAFEGRAEATGAPSSDALLETTAVRKTDPARIGPGPERSP